MELELVRVLHVEDDDAAADATEAALAGARAVRFETERATSVEDALQLLACSSFDLMLLDLTLPEGAGVTTLLRARSAAPTVPIVVLADESDDATALDVLTLGAQEFLVKEDLGSLEHVILSALERHRILSDLREAKRQQYYLATHDHLTGLLNRFSFYERVEEAIARGRRGSSEVAILFVDLDDLKTINDGIGHEAGDQAIRETARRLTRFTRSSDALARFGGDEFLLLVADAPNRSGIEFVATRILRAIQEPMVLGESEYTVRASVGVAFFPDDAETVESLVQAADAAMYRAKAKGGDQYVIADRGITSAAAGRLRSRKAVESVLTEGRLVLAYQPQFDLSTGEMFGLEALLRARSPEGDLIQPERFVGEAESLGLMQGLGERILRIALCDADRLRATCGFRGRVAVNVSAHQVMHPGFPTLVESLLRERKTPPDALELEITETVALHPSDNSVKNVKRLRDLGVGVSMDDFGTGFATIQNLRLMPFSAMKIDRSFVAGVPDKSADVAVTRAILAMGDALGISVTAEGVETEVQLRGLVELGCRRFQGYLLSHPLDLEKLEARMQLDDFPSFEISEKLSI